MPLNALIRFSTNVNACLLSAHFSHAYTSLLYEIHASYKHALISKRYRYFRFVEKIVLDLKFVIL